MERQIYQRRSFIPKVCIECKKEFQAQRNTAMYCGPGCLQANRNRRLAGHQVNTKLTRQSIIAPKPIQKEFQQYTEQQYIDYVNQLHQHINNIGFIMEDKIDTIEKRHKQELKIREDYANREIEQYKKMYNEVLSEVKELRKMNKMWELASKVITGK